MCVSIIVETVGAADSPVVVVECAECVGADGAETYGVYGHSSV